MDPYHCFVGSLVEKTKCFTQPSNGKRTYYLLSLAANDTAGATLINDQLRGKTVFMAALALYRVSSSWVATRF